MPKTNNLVELFYKVTFPGKIKRIYRTVERAMNRSRLNNIKWMEKNVIERHMKKYEKPVRFLTMPDFFKAAKRA